MSAATFSPPVYPVKTVPSVPTPPPMAETIGAWFGRMAIRALIVVVILYVVMDWARR